MSGGVESPVMGKGCRRGGAVVDATSCGVVSCEVIGVGETGLEEQYLCCKSAASLTSSTTFRASTMLDHVGVDDLSHVVRASLRQSVGSFKYCSLIAFSVPTLTPSCTPMLYQFARRSFNSLITVRKSSTVSC